MTTLLASPALRLIRQLSDRAGSSVWLADGGPCRVALKLATHPSEDVRLAREAERAAARSGLVVHRAEAAMALSDVLRRAGRWEEAAEAATSALETYEAKGDAVQARLAREAIVKLAAATGSGSP